MIAKQSLVLAISDIGSIIIATMSGSFYGIDRDFSTDMGSFLIRGAHQVPEPFTGTPL